MESRKVIPALVGGLPAALALSVVVGLFVYYAVDDGGDAPEGTGRQSAILTSTPPDETSLANWYHVLSEVIGPRPAGDPAAVAKTGRYLDSTLGERNIGFVTRRPLEEPGAPGGEAASPEERWAWIEAEVPGVRAPGEVVLVAARFDTGIAADGTDAQPVAETDSAARTAVLLAAARAMLGDQPERTVRFVLVAGIPDAGDRIVARVASEGARLTSHLMLGDGLGRGTGKLAALPERASTRLSGAPGESGKETTPAGLKATTDELVATVREAAKVQR